MVFWELRTALARALRFDPSRPFVFICSLATKSELDRFAREFTEVARCKTVDLSSPGDVESLMQHLVALFPLDGSPNLYPVGNDA